MAIATIRRRPVGWRYDSIRHSYAARGISTGRRYRAGLEQFGDPQYGGSLSTKLATTLAEKGTSQGSGRLANAWRSFVAGAHADASTKVGGAAEKVLQSGVSATPGLYKYPFLSGAGQVERVGRVGETAVFGFTNAPFSIAQYDPYTGKGAWFGKGLLGGAPRVEPLTKQIVLAPVISEHTGVVGRVAESAVSDPWSLVMLGGAAGSAKTVAVAGKASLAELNAARAAGEVGKLKYGWQWMTRTAPLTRATEPVLTKLAPEGIKAAAARGAAMDTVIAARAASGVSGGVAQPALQHGTNWIARPVLEGGLVWNPVTVVARGVSPQSSDWGYGQFAPQAASSMNVPLPETPIVQGVGAGALPMWRSQGLQAGVGWQLPPGATQ